MAHQQETYLYRKLKSIKDISKMSKHQNSGGKESKPRKALNKVERRGNLTQYDVSRRQELDKNYLKLTLGR